MSDADPFEPITREEISAARARIAGDIRRTPLMRIPGRELGIDCAELWLKLEHLQISGSFKARGMFNRMRSNAVPEAGVVIASGGNAGIAVAVAAKALGVRCEVFVPETSSAAKRAKLAELGAVLTVTGASYADALAASLARQAETGALLMHAYDQREVVIGAGTLAAEVEEEAGVPDRVLVSVGGGGLIAGIASWFQDRCRIDALEPELAPTLYRAREAGTPVDVAVSGVAADSLGARRIGAIAWEVTRAPCGRPAPPCGCGHTRGATRPVDEASPCRRACRRAAPGGLDDADRGAAQGRVGAARHLRRQSRPGTRCDACLNRMPKTAPSGGLVYSTDTGRMCPVCRQPIASCSCATRAHRRRHAVTASPASAARPAAAAARRSRW